MVRLGAGDARVPLIAVVVVTALCAACGGGVLTREYEYEEELYLALDGSATLNVNASVASLVALRGVDLPVDPAARIDREKVRRLFTAPGANPIVSLSRRDGRRFVHVTVDVDDLRTLERIAPLAWSSYRLDRRGDTIEYRQRVGEWRVIFTYDESGHRLVVLGVHPRSSAYRD